MGPSGLICAPPEKWGKGLEEKPAGVAWIGAEWTPPDLVTPATPDQAWRGWNWAWPDKPLKAHGYAEQRDSTSDATGAPKPTKGALSVGVTRFHCIPCHPIHLQVLSQGGRLSLFHQNEKTESVYRVEVPHWLKLSYTRALLADQSDNQSVHDSDPDDTLLFLNKSKEVGKWVDTGQQKEQKRQPKGYETREAGEPLHFCWFRIYTVNHAGQTCSIHRGIFVPCSCVA